MSSQGDPLASNSRARPEPCYLCGQQLSHSDGLQERVFHARFENRIFDGAFRKVVLHASYGFCAV